MKLGLLEDGELYVLAQEVVPAGGSGVDNAPDQRPPLHRARLTLVRGPAHDDATSAREGAQGR